MSEQEIALSGGNSNEEVVRVNDTVRRATSAQSSTVHRFLTYLSKSGLDCSPKFLGIDSKGRESLTYMHGECAISPDHWREDKYILTAADLLREFHDASSGYVGTDIDVWGYVYPDESKHEVICHNDFAPYNLVFDDNGFTSIIDFDLAGPGPRLRDIAYAAYWLTPLSQHATDMRQFAIADAKSGSKRLKLFCRRYGVTPDLPLLDMIDSVLLHMADRNEMERCIGPEKTAQLVAEGHIDHWQAEASAFDRCRHIIEENLFSK